MSQVICQGCGQSFAVPAGYTRNKIQCPGCGVICAVPAGDGAKASSAKAEPSRPARTPTQPARSVSNSTEEDAAIFLRDEPSIPRREEYEPEPDDEPIEADVVASAEPAVREPPVEPMFPCRRCGRPVRRQRECRFCDEETDTLLPVDPDAVPPPASSSPVPTLAPHSLELDDPESLEMLELEDEDEEPSPYETADRDLPRCPKCRKDMKPRAVVCLACGFNVRTRKKAKRTYTPMAQMWDTDMPLSTRFTILGVVLGFQFLVTVGFLVGGASVTVFASWVPLLFLISFVVGTYDRIQLTRDERGRVTLIKQWRVCFIPLAPQKHEVRGYEGVLTGGWNDSGFMEWAICISLLCLGIVPAFVWWYVAIWQNHYHVGLSENHGFKSLTVYRGRSELQMEEITKVLCDATGLQVRS